MDTFGSATLHNIAKIIDIYVLILFVFFSLMFLSAFDTFFNRQAFIVEFVFRFAKLMLFSFDGFMAIGAYFGVFAGFSLNQLVITTVNANGALSF